LQFHRIADTAADFVHLLIHLGYLGRLFAEQ
jgi:hypothetical protein